MTISEGAFWLIISQNTEGVFPNHGSNFKYQPQKSPSNSLPNYLTGFLASSPINYPQFPSRKYKIMVIFCPKALSYICDFTLLLQPIQ
jgi:hypothetical protein